MPALTATHSGPIESIATTIQTDPLGFYSPPMHTASAASDTLDVVRFAPLRLTRPMLVVGITIETTTLASGAGVLETTGLAIYSHDYQEGRPDRLISSPGSINSGPGGSTSGSTITIADGLILRPDQYWLASCATQTVAGTVSQKRQIAISSGNLWIRSNVTNVVMGGLTIPTTNGIFPPVITGGLTIVTVCPRLYLRGISLS